MFCTLRLNRCSTAEASTETSRRVVRERMCAAVQAEEAGLDAVCHLGRGDMRQTLNILQSVVLAHENITEDHVYLCTGNPPPRVVENVVQWLLQEEMQPAFEKIFQLQACSNSTYRNTALLCGSRQPVITSRCLVELYLCT
jgi:DNA polymerase III delta prime subunit